MLLKIFLILVVLLLLLIIILMAVALILGKVPAFIFNVPMMICSYFSKFKRG